MTLSQEQQPQERKGTSATVAPANQQPRSRREARELERRAQAEAQVETEIASDEHPSGVYEINASGNIWNSISRRAASQLSDAASEAERRTGRRVAADRDRAADDEAPAEPLSYATQARPTIPTYDGPSFRQRAQAVTEAASAPEGTFRERSFAPQARPQVMAAAPAAPVGELDYHTQTRVPLSRSQQSASAPATAPSVASVAEVDSLDHTLTRRELRVMRETGALPPFTAADLAPRIEPADAAPAAPSVSPPIGHREPAPLTPVAGIPLGSAFAAYENTATAPMSAIDRAELMAEEPVAPVLSEASAAADTPVEAAQPTSDVEDDLDEASAAPLPDDESHSAPVRAPFVEEPAPFSNEPITGLVGFEALIAQASAGLDAPSVPATGPQPVVGRGQVRPNLPATSTPLTPASAEPVYSPPTGHWSVQAEEADETPLPFDGLLSRNVRASGGSTNALIMPNDPQPDLIHALNSTGEILVTGSLDLPRSLSSTGAPSDHYDSSEIDRLFEASQDEPHADVAPVRAARAVSTHTSTRSVVRPRKRAGGSLPTVLAITAAVMAVGVAALLFSGWVLRIF
jgi:hypothetical protein